MARATITETTNTVRLRNHTDSKVPAIDHLLFGQKATVKFQPHPPTASSAVTNQWTCTRCGGLMVNEFYMDLLDTLGESKLPAKRCVQCGDVVDFVILLNRQQGRQSMPIQLTRQMLSNNCVKKGQ